MYRIYWQPKASKQLLKLKNAPAQQAIIQAVEQLSEPYQCANVKALIHHDYQYRLKVGRYRVFFNTDKIVEIVSIEEVKKRDERTY